MKFPLIKDEAKIVIFLFKYENIILSCTITLFLVILFAILNNYIVTIILSILFVIAILKLIKKFILYKVNSSIIGCFSIHKDSIKVEFNENKLINIFIINQIDKIKLETDYYLFHKNYKSLRSSGIFKIFIYTSDEKIKYIGIINNENEYNKLLKYINNYHNIEHIPKVIS